MFEPLCAKLKAPTPCTSSHTLTQSPQSIHLFGFLTILKLEVSIGSFSVSSSNLISFIPNRIANC